MKQPVTKDRAETRVVNKYHKLYQPLIELVDSLQDLEPGGTLVDDVSIYRDEDKKVHIAYVAKPIMLTITEQDRVFILRVVGTEKNLN